MRYVLCAVNAKYIHSNLAVYCLKSYADSHLSVDADIQIREYTINQYTEEILQDLYKARADVIIFSCYLWNIRCIRELCLELPKICPGISIWVGGPEVSYTGRLFLQENETVSLVMQGEGEAVFCDLIEWHQAGRDISAIEEKAGLTLRTGEGIVDTGPAACIDLDEIPFVYKDFDTFSHRILYYETSRGCPYTCSYCLSSLDRSVRFRSLSLVMEDLDAFLQAGVPQVKFVDRTFNCNKKHAMAIWRYLTEHDKGMTNFHFEIAADLLTEEEFRLFETMRPGLIQLEIGVQSTHPETLSAIRRHTDLAALFSGTDRIHAMGRIHQHLDLIAGLPFEGYDRFGRSFDDLYAHHPDQLQLGFLKVLRGTRMEAQAKEYDILYRSNPPYEVLSTPWLSYGELLKLKQIEDLVETYYNSGQYAVTLSAAVAACEGPFSFYEAFAAFYQEQGYHRTRHTRLDKYHILRQFLLESGKEIDYPDELLTLDYYLTERSKSRPSWAPDLSAYKTYFKDMYRQQGDFLFPDMVSKGTYQSRTMANQCHMERFSFDPVKLSEEGILVRKETFCLFDYTKRHPLTGRARLVVWTT